MIRRRLWACAASGAALLAMLWPLFSDVEDSFPISTYPMFTKTRGKPQVHQLVGIDSLGRRHPLSPEFVGTSEVLQAKVLIRQAVSRGRKSRRALCKKAARAVASSGLAYERVELVAARFDPIRYFTESAQPISEKRLAHCQVEAK